MAFVVYKVEEGARLVEDGVSHPDAGQLSRAAAGHGLDAYPGNVNEDVNPGDFITGGRSVAVRAARRCSGQTGGGGVQVPDSGGVQRVGDPPSYLAGRPRIDHRTRRG